MSSTNVYKTKAMEKLEQVLSIWSPAMNNCVAVYGEVGVGKTFTVNYVAKKLGYNVVDYGQEYDGDIEQIIRVASTRSWFGKGLVVLLDRPLLWLKSTDLREILRRASNPVVIEYLTEERKYYSWLHCYEIRVDPPPKTWIVQQIKKNKTVPKPLFRMVSNDVRQSLLLAYGSEGYTTIKWFEAVERFLKQGEKEGLERSHLPVILDTALKAYYGIDLLKMIEQLVVVDLASAQKDRTWLLKYIKPTFRSYDISLRYYDKLREMKELVEREKK